MQKPARFFSLTLLAACSAVSADLAVVREHYPLGDADAVRIAGRNSGEIEAILGYAGRAAMIHRDDMALASDGSA